MNRKIENPFLYVEVSDRGAELMRIMRKDTGAEILWNGDLQRPDCGAVLAKAQGGEQQ